MGETIDNFKKEYDLKKSAHPFTILLSLIFKAVPLVCYMFIFNFIIDNASMNLIIVYILATVDYWFIKNIGGRLLVGLRWTRLIDDDGVEVIVYEHRKEDDVVNAVDSKCFWGLQYLNTIVWVSFAIFNAITVDPTDLVVLSVPAILTSYNTYHFVQCSSDQKEHILGLKNKVGNYAVKKGIENV